MIGTVRVNLNPKCPWDTSSYMNVILEKSLHSMLCELTRRHLAPYKITYLSSYPREILKIAQSSETIRANLYPQCPWDTSSLANTQTGRVRSLLYRYVDVKKAPSTTQQHLAWPLVIQAHCHNAPRLCHCPATVNAPLTAAAAEAAKHTPVVHSESNAGFRVLVLLQQSEQRKQENEHWQQRDGVSTISYFHITGAQLELSQDGCQELESRVEGGLLGSQSSTILQNLPHFTCFQKVDAPKCSLVLTQVTALKVYF